MKIKILTILFLVVGTMTFQSCKKESSPSAAVNLKGRWDASSAIIEVFENNVSKTKQSKTIDKNALYFIFTDTKVELYLDSKLDDDGTYTYDQNTKVLTIKYSPTDTETFNLSNVTTTSFSLTEEDVVVNGAKTTKTVSQIDFKKQ